ncbi:MAG: aldehyde ferredoxin oxidoreductase family protein [Thermodesulfobacteriota bacterium]|nr:aldehyde ferredoxin oxidoreductase family protein [Thermodesulfobacteriota bacterium]
MDEIRGALNRILDIDLSKKIYSIFEVTKEEREMFLGGKGLGIKLLFDRLEPGINPLEKENIIAVMPGVLTGTGAVCSGRFHAVFKSPLTGIMASSSCGGPFGTRLKSAGYGGMLVRGKSEKPCLIHIDHEKVEFIDADDLWGLNTKVVQEKIVSDTKEAALVIGPGGENLVRFANAASEKRFLGRGGLGAVMGSKRLKGIVALGGQYKIVPHDPEKFKELKKRGNTYINRNEISLSMRKYGTAVNLKPVNRTKMLPVWNFSMGSHEHALKITGEMIEKKNKTTYHTCKPCSIMCGHKGDFSGKKTTVPEYETIALLGSNLGIFDREKISEFNDLCNELGLDTISAGGTIAWVMEASEKGYIDTSLRFGSADGVAEALNDIANGHGFGKEMGLGTRALADKYGGKEFAIQVKGLEMAGYDPRGCYGQGLSYAVANRGACHLSASLMGFEVFLGLLKPDTVKAKPEFVKFMEDFTAGVNSLQACQFTMYAYTLEPVLSRYTPVPVLAFLMQNLPALAISLMDFSLYPQLFSAVTGIKISSKKFIQAGERIHVLERYMNTREGICKKDDTLPDRMLFEIMPEDSKKRMVPLDEMVDLYYKKRGYNSDGVPKPSCLRKLKIET